MAKTEKELMELKEKVVELRKELSELSSEELAKVCGGLAESGEGENNDDLGWNSDWGEHGYFRD